MGHTIPNGIKRLLNGEVSVTDIKNQVREASRNPRDLEFVATDQ